MSDEPRPYIRRREQHGRARYELVDPRVLPDGRLWWTSLMLGDHADPRDALARLGARIRERESWLGPRPDHEELYEIALAWERHEALAAAVTRFEASR